MCPPCRNNIRVRSKHEAHHKQIYLRVEQRAQITGSQPDQCPSSLFLEDHLPHYSAYKTAVFLAKQYFKSRKEPSYKRRNTILESAFARRLDSLKSLVSNSTDNIILRFLTMNDFVMVVTQ